MQACMHARTSVRDTKQQVPIGSYLVANNAKHPSRANYRHAAAETPYIDVTTPPIDLDSLGLARMLQEETVLEDC